MSRATVGAANRRQYCKYIWLAAASKLWRPTPNRKHRGSKSAMKSCETRCAVRRIALTVLCWGMYGPMLQAWPTRDVHDPAMCRQRLRPFVCVGLAYFLIGVIVPALWLHFRGEKGDWTITRHHLESCGRCAGRVGALGIILAFTFGGRPDLCDAARVRRRTGGQCVSHDLLAGR